MEVTRSDAIVLGEPRERRFGDIPADGLPFPSC